MADQTPVQHGVRLRLVDEGGWHWSRGCEPDIEVEVVKDVGPQALHPWQACIQVAEVRALLRFQVA